MKYTDCNYTSIFSANPINLLWCLLSLMVGGMATFAFLQPFWLIEAQSPHCLGIYSYCVKDTDRSHQDNQICGFYGGRFSLQDLPSLEWKITCILFGGGCLLHLICAVFGISTLCIGKTSRRRLACFLGFIQAIAVIFSVVGLILFPMGFNSKLVQHYCSSDSKRFNAGKCEAGWGLLLATMGTALSIFCPILAQFFDVRVCDKPYYNSQSIYKLELNSLVKHLEILEERDLEMSTDMNMNEQYQKPIFTTKSSNNNIINNNNNNNIFPFSTYSSSTEHSIPSFA